MKSEKYTKHIDLKMKQRTSIYEVPFSHTIIEILA